MSGTRIGQGAEGLLRPRGWGLLRAYGKLVSHSGSYVSGLPFSETRKLLFALQRGERIAVHLMHHHRSGNYESSELSLTHCRLVMHYPGRSERAE